MKCPYDQEECDPVEDMECICDYCPMKVTS
jgi:hypothetical protein